MEGMMDTDQEFSAAFDEAPKTQQQTDDEAFGLTEAATDSAPEAGQPADEAAGAAPVPGETGETPAEAQAEAQSPGGEAGEAPAEAAAEGELAPEDAQRAKSWEGRLKAREAQLRAREEALAAKEEALNGKGAAPAEDGEGQGGPSKEEVAEVVAEVAQKASPELADAVKRLAEDFGDEFVGLIQAVARGAAAEVGSGSGKDILARIDAMQGLLAEQHFDAIAADHEDFEEISESPKFDEWKSSLPPDQQARVERVVEAGSARAVSKMLDTFKGWLKSSEAAQPAGDGDEDPFSDAPEAPPSSAPLKLPSQPRAGGDDFDAAWEEASAA